jgi:type I restriction enzyme S subunit
MITPSEIVPFTEFFKVQSSPHVGYKQKEYKLNGKVPIIDQGSSLIGGYTDELDRVLSINHPVIVFGDHTRCVKFVDFDFAIGADGVKVLAVGEEVLPKFAYLQLKSVEIRNRGYARHMGELKKATFWKPHLETQIQIVEVLEEHLSRLDQALVAVDMARRNEKLFKQSLLHSLFENLDCNVYDLGDVSKPKYGKDVPKHLRGDTLTYPVVGSAGVMTYTEVPLVERPSVLVGRKGNVGAVQMFTSPCSPVDTAYYLICPDDVNLEFMFFQLQSIDLKSLDSSTTIPSLRRQDLEAVQFKKPDLTTQEAISQEIKAKLSSIDAALDQLGAISAGLSVLRRSLLNSAFTGKLLKEMR